MVSPGLTPVSAAGSSSRRLPQDNYHHSCGDHNYTSNDDHHNPANYDDNHVFDNDIKDDDTTRDDHNDVATGDADFDNLIYHHGTRDLNNYADININ